MMRVDWVLAGCLALSVVGCASETPSQDGGTHDVVRDVPLREDSHTIDATTADSGVSDAGDSGSGRACASDTDCVDEDRCTVDTCTPRGVCSNVRDVTCSFVQIGAMGRPFSDVGMRNVALDSALGGLTFRAGAGQGDFLWIPNTNESTVSKWDASMGREIARYRVGLPSGECRGMCCNVARCNQPSRVAVDAFGDVYVASRGVAMQGSVTKIAHKRHDCVDRNANGTIETSSGPTDVMPFGHDECVHWTSRVGPVGAVLQSIAIDRGNPDFPRGFAWVGSCGSSSAGLFKLNPLNGEVIASRPFDRCAFGSVVTPDGTLWEHSPGRSLTPINVVTSTTGAYVPLPARDALGGRWCATDVAEPDTSYSHGITTDSRGRLWLSGLRCADALGYDPMTRTWTRVDLSSAAGYSGPTLRQYTGAGITVDASNRVWTPVVRADGNTALASWDADAFVSNGVVAPSAVTVREPGMPFATPSAISTDRAGRIWVATSDAPSPLLRFDPSTGASLLLTGPNRVDTHTDFNSAARRAPITIGQHVETIDACEFGRFLELEWSADTPPGTSLDFFIQISHSEAALGGAQYALIARAPRDRSPIRLEEPLRILGSSGGRFARITVAFEADAPPSTATPVLRSLGLTWRCEG